MGSFFSGENKANDIFGGSSEEFSREALDARIAAEAAAEAAEIAAAKTTQDVATSESLKTGAETAKNEAEVAAQQAQTSAQSIDADVLAAQQAATAAEAASNDAQAAVQFLKTMNTVAVTLENNQASTANYDEPSNTLTLGIPKGKDGTGGGVSGRQIGDIISFVGSVEDIPYPGEWHNMSQTKVFDESEYPEFVEKGRDELEGAGGLMPINKYSDGNYNSFAYGEYDMNGSYFMTLNDVASDPYTRYPRITIDQFNYGTYQSILRLFNNYYYFLTPGSDDGAGGGSSTISSGSYIYSKEEISGVKLYDGTVVNRAIICTMCARPSSSNNNYAISVLNCDGYALDMSDYVEPSSSDIILRRNEYNSYNVGDPTDRVAEIMYRPDSFYVFFYNQGLKRFSYDFTGGTLKDLPLSYDTGLNVQEDRPKTTNIDLDGNVYQVNTSTGELLRNGSVVHQMLFSRPLANPDDDWQNFQGSLGDVVTGQGDFNLMVNQFQDKVLVYFNAIDNQDTTVGVNGGAYFDGTSWNSFTIPYSYELQEGGQFIVKCNLSTGLIVALTKDAKGTGTKGSTTVENRFVISTDYGSTWKEDPNITPTSSYDPVNRTAPLYLFQSYDCGHANGNFQYIPDAYAMQKRAFSNDDYVCIATDQEVDKFEFINDTPLTTSTVIGQVNEYNKMNKFIKVKD